MGIYTYSRAYIYIYIYIHIHGHSYIHIFCAVHVYGHIHNVCPRYLHTHTHTQTHMCVFIASFFSIEDGAGFRGSGFVGLRSLGIDSPFGEGYCCVT